MMKKKTAVLLSICLVCAAAFAGCQSKTPEAVSDTKESVQIKVDTEDLLVKHEFYVTAEGEGWTEYMGLYSGKDTDKLTALTIETQFDKSAGYTMDLFEDEDIDDTYPGFSKLSFANYLLNEDEDSISMVLLFRDLDTYKNAKELVDKGFIDYNTRKLSKDKHFVAEEFRKFLTDNGAEEVKLLDYDKLYIYKG